MSEQIAEVQMSFGWIPPWLKTGITVTTFAALVWYAASDHEAITKRLTQVETEETQQRQLNDQMLLELQKIERRETSIVTILHHLDPTVPIPDMDFDVQKPQTFLIPSQKTEKPEEVTF